MSDPRPFTLDWERSARIGLPEAVLCEGKAPEHVAGILAEAADRPLLLTRLSPDQYAVIGPAGANLDYDPLSRTAIHGAPAAPTRGGVAVVAAGTSDLAVAEEARRTLRFHGISASLVADVGVAGLWRLTARLPEIAEHRVVIACAGMEGALFSVLGGFIAAPIIAVPTAVGYGVAEGGRAALSSALASCAPGIVTVNVGNGYGAACAALRVLGPQA